jgi:two-component system sensor histidine kinase HydH
MSLRRYPNRVLVATTAASLLLLATSTGVAVYLNVEQARTAEVLGENIGSRRAAADLAETISDLIALHDRGATSVEALHERVAAHLAEIDRFADKPQERALADRLSGSFADYLELWRRGQVPAAVECLKTRTLPACLRLREFNAGQIESSERDLRRALAWMAWGFAAVGLLGSVAGLVLGYGLARGLRREVDSLLVRVQLATDLLGQELATVRVEQAGASVRDGVEDLVGQVERTVGRLQEREREVRRAERLAAVGQLAAGVAHEIRNPLTAVQLLIQTARKDPSAGALTEDDLTLIDAELGRVEQSLRTFLDYARPPKLERVSCVLSGVARDALALVQPRATLQGVKLRFGPTSVPITLDADPEQLRQVILNLLLNALDAMPVGGTLEMAVISTGDGGVELIVADSGPGIPSTVLPRLFEPFVTGKETGLGLGLVVSRRIVQDHGGTIRGFNRPEGGACFVVRLPPRDLGVSNLQFRG